MKAYMMLSCKASAFNTIFDEIAVNTVLNKLIHMKLSMNDVFLLSGLFDILVQVHFKDLNEFINRWFNPISAITPEEAMIEKTEMIEKMETLFVLSEGKQYAQMPYAFLFHNTHPRNVTQVQQDLQSIPNVLSTDIVLGPYDLVSAVKASNKEDLKRLILKIQKEIPNILGTVTGIVASIN